MKKIPDLLDKFSRWVDIHLKLLIIFILIFMLLGFGEYFLLTNSPLLLLLQPFTNYSIILFFVVLLLIYLVAIAQNVRFFLLGFLIVLLSFLGPLALVIIDIKILIILFCIGNALISYRVAERCNTISFKKFREVFYPVKKVTSKKYRYAGKEITETTEEKNYSFIYIFLLILPSIIQFVMSWLGKK